ncbi:hypothetical protein EDC27_0379 [Desulfosoma caldarium]|uniref:Uncharacterized protein n=1 Tax=Desulfosoma caldarium TaxID=610254 RepID=A0A3N1VJY2_9BACT|nr:hypothetical protein EDC27_0379 [Desulfosoma caldarium]
MGGELRRCRGRGGKKITSTAKTRESLGGAHGLCAPVLFGVMTPRNQDQNVRCCDRAALGFSVGITSGQPLWLPLIGSGKGPAGQAQGPAPTRGIHADCQEIRPLDSAFHQMRQRSSGSHVVAGGFSRSIDLRWGCLADIVLPCHIHDGFVAFENLQHDLPLTIGRSSLPSNWLNHAFLHRTPPFADQIQRLWLVQSNAGSL